MIDIKDIQGNVVYSTPINVGSKRKYTLMQEDYITLMFSTDEPLDFELGVGVDNEIGLFELVTPYKPKYNNNTGGYDYELRLDAYYYKWKNKIFKFTPEVGGQEASWSLTASLDVHLGIFLRNLQALGYTYRGTEFEFSIDATVENKAIGMTYENMNMIDALSAMAESWDCEWWITDNIIHFGRCEYGDAVDFIIGENVAEMTRSESKSEYATRLYVFGSTRNLPSSYRPTDESVVVNGVVQRRLMLPSGIPYIDAYEGMSQEEAIEEVVILEDVYPKTDGNISSVETYTDSVENEDGTTTEETFYRFKDNGITFSKDYILEGEELRVKFTSGSLNGMEFGLAFNPKGVEEKTDGAWNPEAQLFEVVANEDYGRKLPDSTLNPKVGDTYILIGWDSTKIADLGLVSAAEEQLYQEGLKLSAKRKIDPNTYGCKMFSDYMYGLDENGSQNPDYAKSFEVGDRVNLVNSAYFKDGRQSRIIGYEYSLDIPYDSPTYTVGETSAYSRLGALETKLEALTYAGQTYTGGGGSGVYVIGTNDSTKPTNRNVYSALRSDKQFLRKDQDDRSKGKIASDVGFEVGTFVSGASGAIIQVDKTTGQTVAELDKLYVRMKAYFETLEIINVNSVGGRMILSPAGSVTCLGVEELDDAYRCYFLGEQDGELIENRFEVGDQAYSEMFNAKTGVTNKVSNHYYWRLVTGVSEDVVDYNNQKCHYIELSKTDCDANSDVPKAGDVICHRGSRTDTDRMNFIEFSSVGVNAPYITLFQGVGGTAPYYSLTDKEYVSYGYDQSTGRAYMNVYGDMYVGDRNQTSYIRYTPENGLEIKGKLSVGTTLGGKDLQEMINAASPEGYQEFVDKVTQDIEGLQNQIDGTIDSYFFQYNPSLTNYPASEWDTENEKIAHLNDTFTNIASDSGRSWRWVKDPNTGVYSWTEITDTATTQALALAGQAQDTADGKRRVFTSTPTPPYNVGDLWAGGSEVPLKRCIVERLTGTYDANDWDYADNTEKVKQEMQSLVETTKGDLNNAIGQANEAIGKLDESLTQAKTDLQGALNELNDAKDDIDSIYDWATKDGEFTDIEKVALDAAITQSNAAVEYYDTLVKAYADGTISEEEKAKIQGAKASLDAAKKYADETAKAVFAEEIDKHYLTQALTQSPDTSILNGLILSSLIQLRDTDSNVMSGINGLIDEAKGDKSIANWWGGIMGDMTDYYTWNGREWVAKSGVTIPSNLPSGLIRMDGTGYLAKGKFWWDANGEIHADPTALLLSFDVKAGDETLASTIINIRKDIAAFTDMWEIKTDANGTEYLFAKRNIVTQGGITSYADTTGLDIEGIYDGLPIDGTTIYWGYDDKGNKTVLKAKVAEGGITSITKDMVIDALGFTPYDASNPNGYITSAALNEYATQTWVNQQGFLTEHQDLSDYQPLITTSNKLAYSLISGTPDLSVYALKSSLHAVATSGSYNDLTNKPTIPTIPASLKNPYPLSWSGYSSGSYDGSSAQSLVIPNNTNQLTNGAGFITSDGFCLGVRDYNATSSNIKIGYTGNGLTASTAGYLAAYGTNTAGERVIKDIAKSEVQSWLGLGSNAYNSTAYLPLSGGTLRSTSSNTPLNLRSNTDATWLAFRDNSDTFLGSIGVQADKEPYIYHNSTSHNLIHSGNISSQSVASATKLQTARTIWGQSFDGTGNITGQLNITGGAAGSMNQGAGQLCIGSITGPHLMMDANDIQAKSNGTTAAPLYLNDWGGDLIMGRNGNVGIGTTSPAYKLHVEGAVKINSFAYFAARNGADALWIGRGSSSNDKLGIYDAYDEVLVYAHGVLTATFNNTNVLISGGITSYSDIRKKEKLQDVQLTLKQIADAPLIEHYYKHDDKKTTHVGSIAQYWAGMNDWFCKLDNEGYYTMEIQNAALASAISIARELVKYESKTDRTIRLLKKRISQLEDEIEILKKGA